MIRIENVSKQIGSKMILENITLTVGKGEILGLIGPNGAGKTTLLSLLSTTEKVEDGEIWIGECSLRKNVKKARRKIGYVPQEIALYPSLSVFDNVTFWAKMLQIKQTKVTELVRLLQLDDFLHEKVDRLSGGYKRRVNIAVALLHEPEVLLMDEPTVGMDLYSKKDLLPFIKHVSKQGTTIVFTSHDVDEMLYLADRIAMLEQGKLIFDGSVDQAKKEIAILQGLNS
ncbi:ABC transporter ATP-binding protein [Halalkalibacter krulwichiae]|uniref:Arginine transport ATP-binding protein ArtM n=1 Tax=Halalkalibacter krulwichiae TaxID=199441 RepID=A0A1X9MBJ9_9BACI|nr:ABC transporter ATP-binding protein [Halalkalibacter krulwichiae]ARK29970.1 Arginine transport ATP-binding protein ArtM [Halalkalibacter krulwichiae]